MKATIEHAGKSISVDFSRPIDISIPLRAGEENVSAWYVDPMEIEPVRTDQFTGSVAEGGTVNFRNISFNPHGNGTHTECVGHISNEVYSVNKELSTYFFWAEVVTVSPEVFDGEEQEWRKKGDKIITKEMLESAFHSNAEAIIIRTTPNQNDKINQQYSNTNWPYLDEEAARWISNKGIKHLLIDLPSVDKEFDGGKMLAHRAFWNYPEATRHGCTITEMIYVADEVKDGEYLLNIQIASFENDASPSKPVLYAIES